MMTEREALVEQIERAREILNASIDGKEDYGQIYQNSIDLDRLIEQYIVAGY